MCLLWIEKYIRNVCLFCFFSSCVFEEGERKLIWSSLEVVSFVEFWEIYMGLELFVYFVV